MSTTGEMWQARMHAQTHLMHRTAPHRAAPRCTAPHFTHRTSHGHERKHAHARARARARTNVIFCTSSVSYVGYRREDLDEREKCRGQCDTDTEP